MGDGELNPFVRISSTKCILRSELLSLLRTYNCYHEGKNFQLRHHEVRTHFQFLSFQSNDERVFFGISKSKIRSQILPDLGEEEITPQLKRTRSDASFVQRRSKHKSPEEAQRLRSHRFSINGHFYDHKTSVFTPAYGSVTNVRVTSTMNTSQVLNLLLKKFRVENSPSEFGLYYLHETGERSKLGDTEFPLICRILHGPCERIARLFIMETDLGVEVSHDVAQYIKFEMPVLCSFVEKLKEEEDREINKLTQRYNAFRMMMLERLEELTSYESYA
uniref:Ras association domain-containing protein 4 n=2 Tax=Pyxicephalus adspersus TaxID=30357 RepID=A0AAV2ZI12_PYXAD|nr:TPA: hypothetical protein GDO54_004669 [Pyxicephalus adspersus]